MIPSPAHPRAAVDKKKLFAYAGFALCLAVAALIYHVLSDTSPKQTPQLNEAERKAQAIQESIAQQQAQLPKPPSTPTPPTVPRGPVRLGE